MDARESRAVVARIAEGQRGLVTTQQAAKAGVSRLDLSRLSAAEEIVRLAQGVYRVSGAPEDHLTDLYAHWLLTDPSRTANERAIDPSRVIAVSHRSAARVYGIGDLPSHEHHFTSTYRKQIARQGVKVSQRLLLPSDYILKDGMFITTAARTIADLLTSEPDEDHVAQAMAEAIETRLASRGSIVEAVHRAGITGAGARVDRMLASRGLTLEKFAHQVAHINGMTDAVTSVVERSLRNALALRSAQPVVYADRASTTAELDQLLAALPTEELDRIAATLSSAGRSQHASR